MGFCCIHRLLQSVNQKHSEEIQNNRYAIRLNKCAESNGLPNDTKGILIRESMNSQANTTDSTINNLKFQSVRTEMKQKIKSTISKKVSDNTICFKSKTFIDAKNFSRNSRKSCARTHLLSSIKQSAPLQKLKGDNSITSKDSPNLVQPIPRLSLLIHTNSTIKTKSTSIVRKTIIQEKSSEFLKKTIPFSNPFVKVTVERVDKVKNFPIGKSETMCTISDAHAFLQEDDLNNKEKLKTEIDEISHKLNTNHNEIIEYTKKIKELKKYISQLAESVNKERNENLTIQCELNNILMGTLS